MQASVSVLQSTASKWGPSTPDSLNVGLPLIDKHSLHMGNGSIARSIFVVALCKNVIKFVVGTYDQPKVMEVCGDVNIDEALGLEWMPEMAGVQVTDFDMDVM